MEEEEEDGKGFLWSVVIITVQAFLLVVIKFFSNLWQVCGFLLFPPPIKLMATT
jgi:hypothetical protein